MNRSIRLTDDIATCLAIRHAVFVEEQGITVADDVDGCDDEALHLLASIDDIPVATARLLMSGDVGKIGRVAVLKAHRGNGLGVALIEGAVDTLRANGVARAMLGAQVDAVGFYEALGFIAYGPEFDDAGILHREMVREL